MIYGQPLPWRETMRFPKVITIDSRILVFVALAVFNISYVTFFLLLVMVPVFIFLAHKQIRVESALRYVRLFLLGLDRPATPLPPRRAVNYSASTSWGRWCPRRLRVIPWFRLPFLFLLAIFLTGYSPPTHAWVYWQGLSSHWVPPSEAELPYVHAPAGPVLFYSPTPVNPDWDMNCLEPGIADQEWCRPALFLPPSTLEPLDPVQQIQRIETSLPPTPPAVPEPPASCIIVRKGDTLGSIARDILGDAALWRSLAQANNLHHPYRIYPGQCLKRPG
ncbi:MAG: IcmT/TraK family protein [Paracoccaceae bacterium]|nr:IcmT/TraK family protein [Paracoccaceae bacterium]